MLCKLQEPHSIFLKMSPYFLLNLALVSFLRILAAVILIIMIMMIIENDVGDETLLCNHLHDLLYSLP